MNSSEIDYLIQEQIERFKDIKCDFNIIVQTTNGYGIIINIKEPYNFKIAR